MSSYTKPSPSKFYNYSNYKILSAKELLEPMMVIPLTLEDHIIMDREDKEKRK